MRIAAIGALLGLLVYSFSLILVELATSQDHVRLYFTDIEGDVPLYAINTTLSAFLLSGSALLLIFAALASRTKGMERSRLFMLLQAGMLLLLAFDDRFQLHEAIAWRLDVGDHYVMSAWAMLQVVLLVFVCRPEIVTLRSTLQFVLGGGFFIIMMIFDVFVAHDAILRLSIEDLSKTWAAAFFLAASWNMARFQLGLAEADLPLANVIAHLQILKSARSTRSTEY